MTPIPSIVSDLADELEKLPGIGPRSAERLAYHILRSPIEEVQKLAGILVKVKEVVKTCSECFNISLNDHCVICADKQRNHQQIMVVEEPLDTVAIEKTNRFQGVYHVLGGVIDPLRGIGVEELRVTELITRIERSLVPDERMEIVLATNPSTEGETTAIYLRKMIKERISADRLIITRIARGLPVGADLEYADPVTLMRSFEGRSDY